MIHRTGDQDADVDEGRWIASQIPGARFVEIPGNDHIPWVGDSVAILDLIQEFLTGVRGPESSDRVLATVLFTDIVGSTEHAAALGDHAWRELLDRHDRLTRREIDRFSGREIKTLGDGFLAAFDGPGRAVRWARAITQEARRIGIEVRCGLHTGECEVRHDDLAGLAVHLGARIGGLAQPGEVLVSTTVKDLVIGSAIEFSDRGEHHLKGVPGSWKLFAVAG
jgi:class 3 adenylate cyclase